MGTKMSENIAETETTTTEAEADVSMDSIKQTVEDKLAQARKVMSDFMQKYLGR